MLCYITPYYIYLILYLYCTILGAGSISVQERQRQRRINRASRRFWTNGYEATRKGTTHNAHTIFSSSSIPLRPPSPPLPFQPAYFFFLFNFHFLCRFPSSSISSIFLPHPFTLPLFSSLQVHSLEAQVRQFVYGVAQKRTKSGLPYATGGPLLLDATQAMAVEGSEFDSENALLRWITVRVWINVCERVSSCHITSILSNVIRSLYISPHSSLTLHSPHSPHTHTSPYSHTHITVSWSMSEEVTWTLMKTF